MTTRNDGLSLGYRLKWRLTYVLLHLAGPATLSEEFDPRSRMRRERAARVARAHQRQDRGPQVVRLSPERPAPAAEAEQRVPADAAHQEQRAA